MELKQEIEKKYLVDLTKLPEKIMSETSESYAIRQGYLNTKVDHTVRLRDIETDCILTIKNRKRGTTASEYEYKIHPESVDALKDELTIISEGSVIEKIRYDISHQASASFNQATERYGISVKEIILDIFNGDNKGLGILEIEFLDSGNEKDRDERIRGFIENTSVVPSWCTDDVTDDFKYTNLKLASKPYSGWITDKADDNEIVKFAREFLTSNLDRGLASSFEKLIRRLELGIDTDTLEELNALVKEDARSLKWD